jgi:hypothetical protein
MFRLMNERKIFSSSNVTNDGFGCPLSKEDPPTVTALVFTSRLDRTLLTLPCS